MILFKRNTLMFNIVPILLSLASIAIFASIVGLTVFVIKKIKDKDKKEKTAAERENNEEIKPPVEPVQENNEKINKPASSENNPIPTVINNNNQQTPNNQTNNTNPIANEPNNTIPKNDIQNNNINTNISNKNENDKFKLAEQYNKNNIQIASKVPTNNLNSVNQINNTHDINKIG